MKNMNLSIRSNIMEVRYKIVNVKNGRVVPKKLNIELPFDTAVLFLSIYPKELKTRIQIDMCILMFTEAVSKEPKCPSLVNA